jgi:hypothetical protein
MESVKGPNGDRTETPPPEVRERIEEGVRAVEAMRTAGLGLAAALQEAKVGALRREVARRRSKHGKGSPEEERALARLGAHEQFGSELALEATLAKRPPSRPDKGAFVLEGHVLDESFEPIGNAVASAVLDDEEHVADDATDERGRFRLVVPIARDAAERPAAVRLEVALEEEGEVVARDDFPQAPTPGNVVYRRVIVAARRESARPKASSSRK